MQGNDQCSHLVLVSYETILKLFKFLFPLGLANEKFLLSLCNALIPFCEAKDLPYTQQNILITFSVFALLIYPRKPAEILQLFLKVKGITFKMERSRKKGKLIFSFRERKLQVLRLIYLRLIKNTNFLHLFMIREKKLFVESFVVDRKVFAEVLMT